MPVYNVFPIATSVLPGDVFYFFGSGSGGEEVIPNGTASRQFAMAYVPSAAGQPTSLGVDFHYSSAPTSPVILIQVSNIDSDADYITIYTSATDPNVGQDWHVDIPLGMYRFVRVKKTSVTNGGLFTAVGTR